MTTYIVDTFYLVFYATRGYIFTIWIHSPIMHTLYFQQLYLRKIMKFVLGELFQNGAFWLVFNLLLICSFSIKTKQNFEFLCSFVLLLKSKKKFELNRKGCIVKNLGQSCFLLNYKSVISSICINKFAQKCQYYYTLLGLW